MNKKKKEGEGMKKENVHAKHKKSLAERFWKQKYLFLLLIPSLVWVILICYAPMTGLYMSFINYTPQGSGYFADRRIRSLSVLTGSSISFPQISQKS